MKASSLRAPRGRARTLQAWIGLGVALTILVAWLGSLLWWLAQPALERPWWQWPLAIGVQTFLYTGLFITAHDAMHGIVFPLHRRVNDAIGQIAAGCYALFHFKAMREAHWAHHGHPGQVGADPDFHDGSRRSLPGWYLTFLWRYLKLYQVLGMAVIFNVLLHVVGVDELALLVFWVLPSLLSTVQLFVFGTYLPHRESEAGYPDEHRARSSGWPSWLSLLTCYHFGYHWEHHAFPFVPWWDLPRVRRMVADQHID